MRQLAFLRELKWHSSKIEVGYYCIVYHVSWFIVVTVNSNWWRLNTPNTIFIHHLFNKSISIHLKMIKSISCVQFSETSRTPLCDRCHTKVIFYKCFSKAVLVFVWLWLLCYAVIQLHKKKCICCHFYRYRKSTTKYCDDILSSYRPTLLKNVIFWQLILIYMLTKWCD